MSVLLWTRFFIVIIHPISRMYCEESNGLTALLMFFYLSL